MIRSVKELEAAIHEYIDVDNEDPKPFVWTRTAGQILDSIARYAQPPSPSSVNLCHEPLGQETSEKQPDCASALNTRGPALPAQTDGGFQAPAHCPEPAAAAAMLATSALSCGWPHTLSTES